MTCKMISIESFCGEWFRIYRRDEKKGSKRYGFELWSSARQAWTGPQEFRYRTIRDARTAARLTIWHKKELHKASDESAKGVI